MAATTKFEDIKRALPFSAPGSVKDDEVYALVAYILSEGKIIKPTEVMDTKTLPKVAMPNRDGFIPDARPELSLTGDGASSPWSGATAACV